MSVCAVPSIAANSAVATPTHATISIATGACRYSGDMRAIMYTPAVTMVAAWISADTGVGPSIASGSQTNSGICADFPVAPSSSSAAITVSVPNPCSIGRPATPAKISENWRDPNVTTVSSIASEKP